MTDPTAASPDPAGPLDLDAWLDDVTLPEADVTIYARADLAAAYDRLTTALRDAHTADEQVAEDDRGIDHGTTAATLEQERADTIAAMRASARTFRLTGLTQDAVGDLVKATTDPATGRMDQDLYLTLAIARAASMTPEQVGKLRTRLPLSEWMKLVTATNDLLGGKVDLPFS